MLLAVCSHVSTLDLRRRLLTTIGFIEEVLPFTDIVPTATIGWFMEYTRLGKKAQGALSPFRACQ